MISRRQTCQIISGAAFLAAVPAQSFAHRQKTTLSQVEWNDADKSLYVTHSYHLHDAEIALAAAGILNKPDLTSLRARAKLALYTARKFQLSIQGKVIDLDILGAERDGKTIYVYQETHLEKAPNELLITATMLREIIPGQINNVDVTLSRDLTSLQFKGSDGPKKAL